MFYYLLWGKEKLRKEKKYKKVEPLNPKICLECPLGNVHEILYYIATIIILVRTLWVCFVIFSGQECEKLLTSLHFVFWMTFQKFRLPMNRWTIKSVQMPVQSCCHVASIPACILLPLLPYPSSFRSILRLHPVTCG